MVVMMSQKRGNMDVYIESPVTNEYVENMTCLLESAIAVSDEQAWNPKRLASSLVNRLVTDLINQQDSEAIQDLKDCYKEDFNYLSIIAQDIRDQLIDHFLLMSIAASSVKVKKLTITGSLIYLKVVPIHEL